MGLTQAELAELDKEEQEKLKAWGALDQEVAEEAARLKQRMEGRDRSSSNKDANATQDPQKEEFFRIVQEVAHEEEQLQAVLRKGAEKRATLKARQEELSQKLSQVLPRQDLDKVRQPLRSPAEEAQYQSLSRPEKIAALRKKEAELTQKIQADIS